MASRTTPTATIHEDKRGIGFVEAGFYRDSGSRPAKIAGVGYQAKLDKRWRLGGALLAVQSKTCNDGSAFIAPLPILTCDLGKVKLNAVYIPRYGEYNQFAVFGFYLSVPLAEGD